MCSLLQKFIKSCEAKRSEIQIGDVTFCFCGKNFVLISSILNVELQNFCLLCKYSPTNFSVFFSSPAKLHTSRFIQISQKMIVWYQFLFLKAKTFLKFCKRIGVTVLIDETKTKLTIVSFLVPKILNPFL